MQRPLLRSKKSRFHDPKVFGLCVLAIVAVLVLLYARSRDGQSKATGPAPGTTVKQPSGYHNRATLPSSPSVGRPAAAPAITGNVYGTDGAPIAGVTVVATTYETSGNVPSLARAVRTDEIGHFELAVANGTYHINASREGYGPSAALAHSGESISLVMPQSGVITGHVRDEQNAPVRHFTIDLISQVPGDLPAPPPLWSRNFDSPDGSFRIDQVPSWIVLVKATAADHASVVSTSVEVGPGATVEVDLTVVSGCTLAGRVEDSSGAPQPDVLVDAEVRLGEDVSDPSVQTAAQVETESDGSFRLENVPKGSVTFRAYGGNSAVASLTVEIADCAQAAPVKLTLSSGGGVAGVARRQDGTPLAMARVALTARSIGIVNTMSDAEGRFRFDRIPDESVHLELHHDGRSATMSVGVKEGEVTRQDIALPGDGAAELRGRVTAAGKPLSGIQLVVASSLGPDHGMGLYHPVTDAEGNYRVPGIAPGNYIVAVLSTTEARSVHIEDLGVTNVSLDVGDRTAANQAD